MLGGRVLTNQGSIWPARQESDGDASGRGSSVPPALVAFEIVGVVRDVRNVPLGQAVEPTIYFSARQFPFGELFLTVRAADTATGVQAVRSTLRAVTPSTPMGKAQTWGDAGGARRNNVC